MGSAPGWGSNEYKSIYSLRAIYTGDFGRDLVIFKINKTQN